MTKNINKVSSVAHKQPETSVAEIIRAARGYKTQTAFAEQLQTSQSLMSKYESGATNPPSEIINKCIDIIHEKNIEDEVSLEMLEARMRKVLNGSLQASARRAFAVILDSFA